MDIVVKNAKAIDLKERLDVPMAILAIFWVIVIVASLILEETDPIKNSLEGLDWIIWFVFLIEYITLVFIAEERIFYIRQNILDLVVVFLPALRILRIAKPLEIFKDATVFSETFRGIELFLHHKKIYHLLFLVFFLVVTSGVLIHIVEAPYNPIFELYSHSFMWALTTILTFGHSGIYPISPIGQIIDIGLIICGIASMIYFTVSLFLWFIKKRIP